MMSNEEFREIEQHILEMKKLLNDADKTQNAIAAKNLIDSILTMGVD